MKSIVIAEPGKVEIKEMHEAPKRKSGEALLKLLYGGICGSDLNTYRGGNAYVVYPCIPGHEFSAEIVEIDENDKGLKVGDVVTCNPYFNCGHCYSCERGLVNCCMDNKTMGVQREGAFSEYITMPIERIYSGCGLSARQLTLIEPFCIAYHGAKRGQVKSGDYVLVIGAGPIGTLAAVSAKLLGAKATICDLVKEKVEYSKNTFGLDDTIVNTSNEDFIKQVNEKTGGKGYDVVIEVVGQPSTFVNSIDAAAFGGRVVLVGISAKNINDFFFAIIQKKELNIMGSRNALKEDFLELINFVKQGKVDIEKIISDEFSWTDADKALEHYKTNLGKTLKVILKF